MEGIPVMARRIVWIDSNRTQMLGLGGDPIVVFAYCCKPERAPGFCRRWVQLNCLGRCQFCQRRRFGERANTKHAEPIVIVGHARIGQRVIWIPLNSTAVTLERLCQTGFGVTVPVVPATQV